MYVYIYIHIYIYIYIYIHIYIYMIHVDTHIWRILSYLHDSCFHAWCVAHAAVNRQVEMLRSSRAAPTMLSCRARWETVGLPCGSGCSGNVCIPWPSRWRGGRWSQDQSPSLEISRTCTNMLLTPKILHQRLRASMQEFLTFKQGFARS